MSAVDTSSGVEVVDLLSLVASHKVVVLRLLHTLWEEEASANPKQKASIERQISELTSIPPGHVRGWTRYHSFAAVWMDIVDVVGNRNFDNPLVAPLFHLGLHVVEVNFSWVFARRDCAGALIPASPVVKDSTLMFDPECRVFALVFPASPEFGALHPCAFVDSVVGRLDLKYFPYALGYVLPVLDVIRSFPLDAVLCAGHGCSETAGEVLDQMAVPDSSGNVFYSGGSAEFVDPRVGRHFVSLMKFVDCLFGVKSEGSDWQKYAKRDAKFFCRAGGQALPASLMRKHYPFGSPSSAPGDVLASLDIETKMHVPVLGMASGTMNRDIWGQFGDLVLFAPVTLEEFTVAWDTWFARGPEISIAYGLGGSEQTKFSWFDGKLYMVPAFPALFADHFSSKLQRIYSGAHVSKRRRM